MKYLLLSLVLGAGPALAQEAPPPGGGGLAPYVGTYRLTRDRIGICDERVRVWSSDGLSGDSFQVWVGRYFFREVNGGPQKYDNDFERGVRTSTFAGGRLVFEQRSYHKIKRLNEHQRVVASFGKGSLHLTSNLWGSPPIEGDCSYRRVVRSDDDGSLDDGGTGDDNLDPHHGKGDRRRGRR